MRRSTGGGAREKGLLGGSHSFRAEDVDAYERALIPCATIVVSMAQAEEVWYTLQRKLWCSCSDAQRRAGATEENSVLPALGRLSQETLPPP